MARDLRPGTLCLAALVALAFATSLVRADDPKDHDPPKLAAESRRFLLTGEVTPEPFVPLHPRTLEDTRRLEAIKLFCIASWLENQNQFRWGEAVEAYRKALEYDPKSLAIYKALIRLATITGRSEDAARYLREAIAIDTEDYDLLSRLGEYLYSRGQPEAAVDLFRKAAESPKLDKHNPIAVIIHFNLGQILEGMRDFDAASDAYQIVADALEHPAEYHLSALPNRPQFLRNRAETIEKIGNAWRQAKRYDKALEAFRRAQAVSPRSSRFFLNIAQVYVDQEKYAEALEALEKYLAEQTPSGSQGYELLASVLGKLGRSDEVLARVAKAAEKDPFNAGLQYFLGTLYEQAGELDKAHETYSAVLKKGGDDRVYKSLAGLYQKEDRFRELILLLGSGLEKQMEGRAVLIDTLEENLRALASDPDVAQKLVDTARDMVREDPQQLNLGARYFVAKVAQGAKLIDAAVEFYRLCLAERPKLAALYGELGRMLASNGRVQEAIGVVQESIREGGREQDADAYLLLGQLLELDGQTEHALEAAGRAVELQSDAPEPYRVQGWIYMHAGQYDKAAERFERILKDFADQKDAVHDARYLLSNLYVQLQQPDKAEEMLSEILQADPDDASANNDLGYLWADQGKNLDQAAAMIKKALDDQPDNAAYLDSMGWVLYKLDRAEKAREYLEKAVEQEEGKDGTITDHLGDVYHRLGDQTKAREMWQKAVELLDDAPGTRRDEKRIQEIQQKLKNLEAQKKTKSEIKRDRSDTP